MRYICLVRALQHTMRGMDGTACARVALTAEEALGEVGAKGGGDLGVSVHGRFAQGREEGRCLMNAD